MLYGECAASHAVHSREVGTRASTLTTEKIVEWVGVNHGGKRVASRSIECPGDYRSTVVAIIAELRALLRQGADHPPVSDVSPIEEAIGIDDVLDELEASGIRVVASVSRPSS